MMKQGHSRPFGLKLMLFVLVAAVVALILGSNLLSLAQSGGTLGYGSKVYGTISTTTPLVTYSFTGQEGDYIAITADSWTGTLDIRLELVAPDGVVLDSGTQNTSLAEPLGAHLSVFLPQTGIYILRLSGDGGTVGDYLLTVLGHAAVTATPLAYGEAVDVTIPAGVPSQYFSFEAEDCPTTLVVSDPSEGQPYAFPFVVKVRDQRGDTVALLRGGEQLEDWVTVEAQSGRYEVEVLAADPALSGSLRLLVTCSGDNPNCPPVAANVSASTCAPCPSLDELVPNGGCPDLGLTATQHPDTPTMVMVSWDLMPGTDGYAVYVTGNLEDGGEVYLTHAEWVAGDPPQFTWILPGAGYVGYTFTLQVLVDGILLCTQETHVDLATTATDCPDLGLTAAITNETTRAITLGWIPGLGADEFDLDLYSILDGTESYSRRIVLPGDAAEYAFDHFPPSLDGVRFVLWMWQDGQLCSGEVTVTFSGNQYYACPDLGLAMSMIDPATNTVLLTWSSLEAVEGYQLTIFGTQEGGDETQLFMSDVLPPGVTSFTYSLPDDDYHFRFLLRLVGAPIECSGEIVAQRQQMPSDVPCAIRADRDGVAVRVGPGTSRSQFIYLLPGIDYTVIGQAADETGALWWQLDKTQFAGHESVISLWVAQADVIAVGDCTQIPQADVPPIVPIPEEPPSGSWGWCGSCDTCGHPANECVTSPEGACLWDPTTCQNQQPVPPGDDGGGQVCFSISASIDMGPCFGDGSAMIDTAPNCEGGLYSPGTAMQAHAVAVDPKCSVQSWSGCGASGSGSSVSFTASGSCTVVAHMGY